MPSNTEDKHVVSFAVQALGPNHEVNNSNKTHITLGQDPNPEVIPLAPGKEIKAHGKLHYSQALHTATLSQ